MIHVRAEDNEASLACSKVGENEVEKLLIRAVVPCREVVQ
jgi:hypothetical protein